MLKKFFNYPVFLVLFLSFIGMMGFSAIVKYHYNGGKKYQLLQKSVMIIATIPETIRMMYLRRTLNINKPPKLYKHLDKKRFKSFVNNKRNALLVLPRYEHSLKRSIVDIIDLSSFKVLHTYKHDISQMNNQVTNIKEFPRLKVDKSPIRFTYQNPLLLEDGSLIGVGGVGYKIDFCSNLLWINDEEQFHHSLMLDHEGNIWTGGRMNPKSKYIKKYEIKDFEDDSIVKINSKGEIIFNKSIIELLIENKLLPENFAFNSFLVNNLDPIHLNDIEPAFTDTDYWHQGDVFISIRSRNAIVHYRPSTNKVINYITGPFAEQHDVDIISDKEISIFNNNNFLVNNKYSEILIYNFETKTFKKLFNDQLRKENFKTNNEGLSHIFKDGSLIVEEQNHGRMILFNNKGEKEWEYVNKDKNGDIGYISWSRLIEDELFIEKFKLLIKNKKCLN